MTTLQKEFYAKNGIVTPGVISVTNGTESTSGTTGAFILSGGFGTNARNTMTGANDSAVLKLIRTVNAAGSTYVGASGDRETANTYDAFHIYNSTITKNISFSIYDSSKVVIATSHSMPVEFASTVEVKVLNNTPSTDGNTGSVVLSGGFATNARNTMTTSADSGILKFIRTTSSTASMYIGTVGDRSATNTYDGFIIFNGASNKWVTFELYDTGVLNIEPTGMSSITISSAATFTVKNTTSSTNTTTGALTVVGGISTQENLNAGGYVKGASLKTGNATIQYNSTSNTLDFIFV